MEQEKSVFSPIDGIVKRIVEIAEYKHPDNFYLTWIFSKYE